MVEINDTTAVSRHYSISPLKNGLRTLPENSRGEKKELNLKITKKVIQKIPTSDDISVEFSLSN